MTEYIRNRSNAPSDNEEGFFCRFTFGQFFALLVLEVFTLFFIFYLGAKYGPEFLGFEKKGPMIVGAATIPKDNSVKVQTTDDPEVTAMAKDLVEKAKTPELKERLALMLKRPPEGRVVSPADVERMEEPQPQPNVDNLRAPTPAQTEEPVATDDGLPKTLGSPSVPMRQASPPAEVEKGVVRIKSAENAKYALQIGSYQQMSEANSVVERWKTKGYPAYLMIADIPDRGRWYRVRLGGFASRDEAKKYQKEVESQEATQVIVVMNEQ